MLPHAAGWPRMPFSQIRARIAVPLFVHRVAPSKGVHAPLALPCERRVVVEGQAVTRRLAGELSCKGCTKPIP